MTYALWSLAAVPALIVLFTTALFGLNDVQIRKAKHLVHGRGWIELGLGLSFALMAWMSFTIAAACLLGASVYTWRGCLLMWGGWGIWVDRPVRALANMDQANYRFRAQYRGNEMNRIYLAIGAFVLWTTAVAWAGWTWRDRSADQAIAAEQTRAAVMAANDKAVARVVEHQQATASQAVAASADARQEQINADYDKRIAAALAGRDADIGRLRKQWAGCETSKLSDPAAVAAAAAEEDRLRRASAARIVRAVELAQSERNECVDQYQVSFSHSALTSK